MGLQNHHDLEGYHDYHHDHDLRHCMAAAVGVVGRAIAGVKKVAHLEDGAEIEEHVEHMSFEAENAEMAAAGHTQGAAAVAAAETGCKLEEHNLDDNSEQTTE